jgi:hypothetical protein
LQTGIKASFSTSGMSFGRGNLVCLRASDIWSLKFDAVFFLFFSFHVRMGQSTCMDVCTEVLELNIDFYIEINCIARGMEK